jgi:crotonobetainyl-CoA:carnitine CoA-transferase CaiB-like acyl-CoA transferase
MPGSSARPQGYDERIGELLAGAVTGPAGPLDGVRVLDLSRIVAAPFATMSLGELGADVIKVERRSVGDDSRTWGPPFAGGESAYYLAVNRNKRSVALELSQKADQDVVRWLAINWADVVVENFRSGVLERWGLGLDQLRNASPRLITASLTGYPAGDRRPGYDFITQADAGVMALIGDPEGAPYKVGYPVADITTGLFMLSGIVSALYCRERTGSGQHVGVSMWESQVAVQVNVNQSYLLTGVAPVRRGNAHPQVSPYETVATSDGYVAVACANDRQFASLMKTVGHPEAGSDPRFATNAARVEHRDEVIGLIESVTRNLTGAEAIAMFEATDIACGIACTTPEVLESENARRSGIVVTMQHPTVGDLPVIRLPWHFSDSTSCPRTPPPLLGEHNELLDDARRQLTE